MCGVQVASARHTAIGAGATFAVLLALRHWDEFAMHVRAARTNRLASEEIVEVVLHSAIYCGVPVANHGFAVAQQVLDSMVQPDD